MKTIAVDEDTWEAIKKLKAKLDARSYDEVLRKLIEAWHLVEFDLKTEKVVLDDDEAELMINLIKDRERAISRGGSHEKTSQEGGL
ncbi:hypothetical protein ADU37_CDS07350 [Thermococcus sp. 2319x1]|uniref:hypothetical protein n=1 Tax=Thermococcus sp. 2319x1 TaxID=1674923 RepID=UPI00073ABEA1|nr:hypothetical protein [Thermococcus sp. 2319x1]ALV62434.1 hypothetical protein ADU37_CDS07350 [Thermococcus sp. 2319x1]